VLALAIALIILCAIPSSQAESGRHTALTIGSETGRSLPRFASIRANVANLRRGPGERYPIAWVYHRRHLPVEIVREYKHWRQVRTPDGTTGWMHQALLSGHRAFIVTGTGCTLRRAPADHAAPVARLEPGVVGQLRRCRAKAAWCQARVRDMTGYVRRADIWGVHPGEAVGD
jgi:SH3-like domain-containing protein